MIADVMADDGISWLRLVTAVVLLALSLAIGQRSERQTHPAPKAVPQPVHESVVAEVELVPFAAPDAATTQPAASLLETQPSASLPDPAMAAPAPATGPAEPLRRGKARQVDRAAQRPAVSQAVRLRRQPAALAVRAPPATRARTRGQVRSEYLRSREIVAALTGEDSGSAYLARVAARQRAAAASRSSAKAMTVAAARRSSR